MSGMYELTDEGYVRCTFGGRERSFRRELFGHTFTEDELETLLEGELVEFDAISKAGKPYRAIVALEEYTFEGRDGEEHTAFGPRLNFEEMNARRGVPATWCSHLFTDAEKRALEAGEKVHLEDCVSKNTGNSFSCDVIFAEEEPGEGKRIIPQFAPRK